MSSASKRAENSDVLIIGGGVIGMAIAETLSTEGLRIRVIESESIGSGASGAAAGMLAPISEGRRDSPLLSLGLESLGRFEGLCARLRDETGIDAEYERSGLLHVAREGVEVDLLRARFEEASAALRAGRWTGIPGLEWLESDALHDSVAVLAPEQSAGFFSPDEAHLRPPLLVRALEAAARLRGVRIDSGIRANRLLIEKGRVVGVESTNGPVLAGETILAVGAWTPSLLDASGVQSACRAIEPVRGQILTLEAPLPSMKSICWSSDAYLVPKRDGSWIVGATEERVGFDRRVTAEGVGWLIERARRVFPSLSSASFGRAWAGLRPVSADGLPFVGRVSSHEGLLVAAGHGRNGVLLSPITAQLIRDELLGKISTGQLRPLSPDRS